MHVFGVGAKAYWDMTIDNDGNLYLVDWYKIRKYDVTTGAVTDLHTEDYLNTGYHFTGVTHWTGTTKLIVTKTTSVTSELWTFDTSDSTWAQLYSAVYYEFYDLGPSFHVPQRQSKAFSQEPERPNYLQHGGGCDPRPAATA